METLVDVCGANFKITGYAVILGILLLVGIGGYVIGYGQGLDKGLKDLDIMEKQFQDMWKDD